MRTIICCMAAALLLAWPASASTGYAAWLEVSVKTALNKRLAFNGDATRATSVRCIVELKMRQYYCIVRSTSGERDGFTIRVNPVTGAWAVTHTIPLN